MSREYGTVLSKFWKAGTGKELRGDANAQILALYLMTSPHANMIGVYFCTLGSMSYETGIPLEGASKALQRLIDEGFCRVDPATDEVFVTNMALHQIGEHLDARDNRCKAVARELSMVNSSLLQREFHDLYAATFHLADRQPEPVDNKALRSPSEAPSKPDADAGADSETDAGAGARARPGAEPPPLAPGEPMPLEYQKFIESERPDLDARLVYGKFTDHYPEPKRTLSMWKKWVRREHRSPEQPSTRNAGAPPRSPTASATARDPTLARMDADSRRAVKPPASVRALRDQLRQSARHPA